MKLTCNVPALKKRMCYCFKDSTFIAFQSAGDLLYKISVFQCNRHKEGSTPSDLNTCSRIQQHSFSSSEIHTSQRDTQVTELMESSSSGTGRCQILRYCSITVEPLHFIKLYKIYSKLQFRIRYLH